MIVITHEYVIVADYKDRDGLLYIAAKLGTSRGNVQFIRSSRVALLLFSVGSFILHSYQSEIANRDTKLRALSQLMLCSRTRVRFIRKKIASCVVCTCVLNESIIARA